MVTTMSLLRTLRHLAGTCCLVCLLLASSEYLQQQLSNQRTLTRVHRTVQEAGTPPESSRTTTAAAVTKMAMVGRTATSSAAEEAEPEYGKVNIRYMPLASTCQLWTRLHGYNNLCWCGAEESACRNASYSPTALQSSHLLRCAPRIFLLGIRKSGTTDLSGWFRNHKAVLSYNVDFHAGARECIVDQTSGAWLSNFRDWPTPFGEKFLRENTLYNDAPGQILQHKHLGLTKDGKTLRVQIGVQHLMPIVTKDTRFLLILRDPAERVISQFYEWKKMRLLPKYRVAELTSDYIHEQVLQQLEKVKDCFREYGPAACIYMTPANDGNMDALLLWGLYVEYLEAAFHFISRDQIMIINLDTYSAAENDTVQQVFEFVGLEYQNRARQEQTRLNKRTRRVSVNATIDLLREFYRPFNRRLADLLRDDKWCFGYC